jgi:hypothetical protein
LLSELEPVDLNGFEPLRFWLAGEAPPAAPQSTRNRDGSIINLLPPLGYWEIALAAMTKKGPLGIWEISYCIPNGPDACIIVTSFDDFFEGVHEILTGRDFGEAMTNAVAKGWPIFSRCLHDGYERDLNTGALLRFKTTRIQWGLTREVAFQPSNPSDLLEGYGAKHFEQHEALTRDLLRETYRGLAEMPGAFDAIAEGDYNTRTLKKIDKRLNETLEYIDLAVKLFGG